MELHITAPGDSRRQQQADRKQAGFRRQEQGRRRGWFRRGVPPQPVETPAPAEQDQQQRHDGICPESEQRHGEQQRLKVVREAKPPRQSGSTVKSANPHKKPA